MHPMRHFRNLVEAPITDFEPLGRGAATQNFDQDDAAFIHDPKTPQRMKNAFARVPVNFALYFLQTEYDYAQYEEDKVACHAFTKQEIDQRYHVDLPHDPSAITIVFAENGSQMGFTPWIVAHDCAHAMLNCNEDMWSLIHRICETIAMQLGYSIKQVVQALGTMASSRDPERFFDSYEFVPELVAQYLIKGKVTLNRITPAVEQFESEINRRIEAMLRDSVGKIFLI